MSWVKKVSSKLLLQGEDLEVIVAEEGFISKKILVVTSKRCIWLVKKSWGRLEEVSDKEWRQIIKEHFKESLFSSNLKIKFYARDQIHPFPQEEDQNVKPEIWVFQKLDKSEANKAYKFMKDMENQWKEIRRKKYLDYLRAQRAQFQRIEQVDPGQVYRHELEDSEPSELDTQTSEDQMQVSGFGRKLLFTMIPVTAVGIVVYLARMFDFDFMHQVSQLIDNLVQMVG
ncbi:hypothetical protein K8T06_00475 [bacterium]|nr:hypothetical protein [bacterium]